MTESVDIVEELAKQIAEDMHLTCKEICKKYKDTPIDETISHKIVDELLNETTVRPILDKLRNNEGSHVNFKKTWNPVLGAKIMAVKSIPTSNYVGFLRSNADFTFHLGNFSCASECDVEKLTNLLKHIVLEPYREHVVKLFDLNKSAGGRRTRKHYRRHKSRRNRRHFHSRRRK
jgi:hypothetical protein